MEARKWGHLLSAEELGGGGDHLTDLKDFELYHRSDRNVPFPVPMTLGACALARGSSRGHGSLPERERQVHPEDTVISIHYRNYAH